MWYRRRVAYVSTAATDAMGVTAYWDTLNTIIHEQDVWGILEYLTIDHTDPKKVAAFFDGPFETIEQAKGNTERGE